MALTKAEEKLVENDWPVKAAECGEGQVEQAQMVGDFCCVLRARGSEIS